MDGLGRALSMEDLLLALSPFHLLTPGQILLQFLINRHNVHLEHPEMLLWSALPHHQFQGFVFDKLFVKETNIWYTNYTKGTYCIRRLTRSVQISPVTVTLFTVTSRLQ